MLMLTKPLPMAHIDHVLMVVNVLDSDTDSLASLTLTKFQALKLACDLLEASGLNWSESVATLGEITGAMAIIEGATQASEA